MTGQPTFGAPPAAAARKGEDWTPDRTLPPWSGLARAAAGGDPAARAEPLRRWIERMKRRRADEARQYEFKFTERNTAGCGAGGVGGIIPVSREKI